MKNLFIPYNLALIAKEKGFSQKEGFRYYAGNGDKLWNYNGKLGSDGIIAPLYQQIVDWFREKHKIQITVCFNEYAVKSCNGYYYTFDKGTRRQNWDGQSKKYYETLNNAIEEAFKLI